MFFWAFTPNSGWTWYTYEGSEKPGIKVRTEFAGAGSGKFIATLNGTSVAATYDGVSVAPSNDTTVATAHTQPSI